MKLEITSKMYWIASQPVDFRKGINGLCRMVIDQLGLTLQVDETPVKVLNQKSKAYLWGCR